MRTGPPQSSGAVAVPVLLVEVSAGQSSTRSAGTLSRGAVVSFTVGRWTQVRLLPQSPVATQVRSITLTIAPGGTGGCRAGGTRGGRCRGRGSAGILVKLPIQIG